MDFSDAKEIADELGSLDGSELLSALVERLGRRIALVSSFGAESAVLLHMAAEVDRSIPVIFIDTGKLFWETRYYRSKLVDRLGLSDIRTVRPLAGDIARADADGSLHKSAPDACCHVRKTLPLQRALEGFDAWIGGRKRFHGGERSGIATLSVDTDGRLKADPLARMGYEDLQAYFQAHELPRHPLSERGYLSVGCVPCTVKGGSAEDPRAGRWSGLEKTECGIHWSLNGKPIRIDRAA
ncbi:MAG: phosphoadenylyl-sulfate reductase [Parvibaculaceae bacterium]